MGIVGEALITRQVRIGLDFFDIRPGSCRWQSCGLAVNIPENRRGRRQCGDRGGGKHDADQKQQTENQLFFGG